MGMISMFRIPQAKQFKYTPIFYDPRKEALIAREQQIKQELGLADETVPRISNIKGKFRSQMKRNKDVKGTSNMRLYIIIAILVAAAYFLFYY
jgi:hypothetical protein